MKESTMQKQRFDKKMKEYNLTQESLFMKLYKGKYGGEIYAKYESNKGNFSKKISGEDSRKFNCDEIAKIEEYLHTSFAYLVNGVEETPTFYDKGLRYAAFNDKEEDYLDLDFQLKNNDLSDSKNRYAYITDEFNKTLLDYILEFQNKNGLRFLIDNNYLTMEYYGTIRLNWYQINDEVFKKVILLLCKNDDGKSFKKLVKWDLLINHDKNYGIFADTDVLKAILDSKKIFNTLFEYKTKSEMSSNYSNCMEDGDYLYFNPILQLVLREALKVKDKYDEKIIKILDFGKKFNDKNCKIWFEQKEEIFNSVKPDEFGYMEGNYRFYLGMIFRVNLNTNINASSIVSNKIDELISQSENIEIECLGSLCTNKKKIILKNGRILKESTNNTDEYNFLQLLENNNYKKSPTVIPNDSEGFDSFSKLNGKCIKIDDFTLNGSLNFITKVSKELKIMNYISKKELKNGKVYCHGNLKSSNVLFDNDEVSGIISWDNTYIGEEYEDFIYVFFEGTPFQNLYIDYEKVFDNFIEMIKAYEPSIEFISNFYDKIKSFLDKDEVLEDQYEDRGDFVSDFRTKSNKYTWLELYKNRLNDLENILDRK